MIENLEGEEWRDIDGYTGLYQVSNKGRVKSLNFGHTGKERLLRPSSMGGYLQVVFYKNGFRKNIRLHRLVANVFISNPENKSEVDHIDTNSKNNCVENLRWATPKENSNNRLTKIHHQSRSKPTYCFETDNIYASVSDASRCLNVHRDNITQCCRGLRNHAGGYHFCYASEMMKERLL